MPALPLVSIVTPSYNQATFLEQTICSVLGQDYAPLEYIIIDGGSTDESVEIIRRYTSRLAWWVSERDSGQAEAINKGLKRARGEIVAWLNSDDLYLPGAIAQAVDALQSNPSLGMVYGDAITIDGSGKPLSRFSFEDWGLEDLASFRIICQPAVFMRRSVLEKAGYLDRSYHFMLDHQLWMRMARLAPIQHVAAGRLTSSAPVHGLWAAARHHPGAKNVSQASGFGRETLRVLEWMRTQPDLASIIQQNRRKVLSGAYRLCGRYYLDEGKAAGALYYYGLSLFNDPSYTLKHKHRIAFAMLSLFKLGPLARPRAVHQAAGRSKQLTTTLQQVSIAPAPQLYSAAAEPYPLKEWTGLDLTG